MINRVEIAGTLKADAELIDTPSGALRAEATVILKDVRYDRRTNADVVETSFIRLTAWEDIAEALGVLAQGTVVHITGQLTQQEVRGRDGKADRKTRVRVLVLNVIRTPRPVPTAAAGDESFPG